MADKIKRLGKGTLGTSSATLFTATTGETTVITEIVLANKSTLDTTATVIVDGVNIVAGKTVPLKDTIVIPLRTVVPAGALVTGQAGAASAIDFYISGMEVS